MDAGYPSADAPLGVETIICRQNIDELPEMWVWARERGIVPYFEMITFQGRAKRQLDLNVSSEELRRVFYELSRIDRERYGLVWEPHPPIAALACNRHEYSCTLNAQGYIQPCVGVDMFIGNIRHAPLAEILATAPVMETMRKLRGNLKGACKIVRTGAASATVAAVWPTTSPATSWRPTRSAGTTPSGSSDAGRRSHCPRSRCRSSACSPSVRRCCCWTDCSRAPRARGRLTR